MLLNIVCKRRSVASVAQWLLGFCRFDCVKRVNGRSQSCPQPLWHTLCRTAPILIRDCVQRGRNPDITFGDL